MPLEWPSTIKVVTNGIELDAVTLDGGEPLEGPPQVEATASEHWNGSIEVVIATDSDARVWNALRTRAQGRANSIAIPICDYRSYLPAAVFAEGSDEVPWFDGEYWDTGFGWLIGVETPYLTAAASAGDTSIDLIHDGTVEAGHIVGIGGYAYTVTTVDGDTLTISPPMRADAADGATLDTTPTVPMRLVSDQTGRPSRAYGRWGTATLEVVEDY